MPPQISLVTTTINVPNALVGYCRQFVERSEFPDQIVIVGDRRTPDLDAWLDTELRWYPGEVRYAGPRAQEQWLQGLGELAKVIPWNSVQRRNIGYLMAAEAGVDTIITVDDDNFATDDAFLESHAHVGRTMNVQTIESDTRWYDPCSLLTTDPPAPLKHRGTPPDQWNREPELTYQRRTGRVVVNEGLWWGTPDADAVFHLLRAPQVVGLAQDALLPVVLAPGTWSPINTQNTAFAADLLPLMFLWIMERDTGVGVISRYDDIFMGYLLRAAADARGELVTYGRPFVRQNRNDHDLVKDMNVESTGMLVGRYLLSALDTIRLEPADYHTMAASLVNEVGVALDELMAPTPVIAYLGQALRELEVWLDACDRVLNK